jgi:hypothetical protein
MSSVDESHEAIERGRSRAVEVPSDRDAPLVLSLWPALGALRAIARWIEADARGREVWRADASAQSTSATPSTW